MRLRSFLPLAAGLLLPLAGCGGRSSSSGVSVSTSSGSSNQTLTIISPHGQEIQDEFKRVFAEKHPGANIKFLDEGGTTDDLGFVVSQFKGRAKDQGINVDLFFGGGAETFLELEKAGALQPLPADYGVPAEINGVPMRSKSKLWVACALSDFGILYNKTLVARDNLPVPASWADMGNPKLRGRIELADPRHSGSAHTAYEIILQTYGWQKGWQVLTSLAGNANSFINQSSQLLQDVQGGQAVLAPAIDFYANGAIARAGADKLGYISPKESQTIVTPDPIGILRGAPNLQLAREFVAFAMSPEGQKLWMLKKGAPGGPQKNDLYRLPALPSLYNPIPKESLIQRNPYATVKGHLFNSDKAALRRTALDSLIGAVLVDNQRLVKAAWAKNPDAAKVTFVPVTEDELNKLAVKWDDPTFKNTTTSAWSQAARAHFSQ